MSLLRKIIESALSNIDHDFYSFHRFDETDPSLQTEELRKLKPVRLSEEKVVQLRVITSGSKEHIVCSYPQEWVKQYVHNSYSQIDPVITKLKHRFNPFIWGHGYFSHEDLDLKEKEQFIKNAQDFKIYQGISVPLGSHKQTHGSMTIAFNRNKFISESNFFFLYSHLKNVGNTIFKLQDFSDGKTDIPLEEYETLFKFLKDSNHSCTSAM